MAASPLAFLKVRRAVLPSIATTSPGAPKKRAVCNHRSIDCNHCQGEWTIYNCVLLFFRRII